MKLAAVILVGLGLVAAVSAALLVRVITMPTPAERAAEQADPTVEILVAKRGLPPLTVVDGSAVTTKTVERSQVSKDVLTNSVQVVGRVLTAAMVEGEAFREGSFARDGSPMYLAASVPPGKRAVSVQLQDWSAMAGLLYPGSVVDVLVSVSFSATEEGEGGESISTTLLQGLPVLAVGSQSVASENEFKDKEPGALASRGSLHQRMVTLLVDPKQAELLQLAMQHGSISLSMRNPLDDERVAQQVTRMNDLSGNSFAGPREQPAFAVAPLNAGGSNSKPPAAKANAANDVFGDPETGDASTLPPELWEMLIIRGEQSQTQTFPMPEELDTEDEVNAVESTGDASVADRAGGG